jgi:hypothetical protein
MRWLSLSQADRSAAGERFIQAVVIDAERIKLLIHWYRNQWLILKFGRKRVIITRRTM